MRGVLNDIISYKKAFIKNIKPQVKRKRRFHRLKDFINQDKINIIAEFKSASPSAGFIKEINFDKIIPVYARYASAISVLTDEKFFKGSFEKLKYVADRVELPVLCKDFIIDKIQIDKAYECGADIVLLIVKILDDEQIAELYTYAKNLNLDVLVEIHSIDEIERINKFKPEIIGVNSRNLDTLSVSLKRAKEILNKVDSSAIKIAESGIKTRDDINFLKDSCNMFLIGETLIKNAEKIDETFRELLNCC